MMKHYPRIRQHDAHGRLILREGLFFCFFLRHSHAEVSKAVTRALDIYLEAIGAERLGWYLDSRGDVEPDEDGGIEAIMRPLDGHGWSKVRASLRDLSSCILRLQEHENSVGGYHFEYHGKASTLLESPAWQGAVSALSLWLPTEYLEEQGASRVRDLAVALARELPLTSGYVSLAFNQLVRFADVVRTVHAQCLHYPGMDVHDVSQTSMEIGARVRGAYWLNFYGQPLLDPLGGIQGLRKRLDSPQVRVEELDNEKIVVALGDRPDVGNEEPRGALPLHRALARVMEPLLYKEGPGWFDFSPTQLKQWHRRFLD